MPETLFPTALDAAALERGAALAPSFNGDGLIAAILQHAQTDEVLMLGWMNAEALRRTLDSGEVWFFSRARQELWHKGDTSGQIQQVVEIRVDCDQDAVLVKVLPQGDGGVCHVGFRSCFYRIWEEGQLAERP
ncbi:MAG TPA: phosphoribosyl-AMP cyclohydrolase [Caulobacteraceae bacterium]|nr:phosphoribosyl-AMP cyclohydrolase [Caulobacteraceae bacterium]